MSIVREEKIYKTFIVSISLAIALVLSVIFLGIAIKTSRLIEETTLTQARAIFNSIVLTRKWNAGYGGVYVEKKKGVESNPYLEDPDITTIDGTVYTKKNPALMTREISQLSENETGFKFRITSLKPINPDNAPDEFEKRSLRLFEQGRKEVYRKELINGKFFFRYMAPLFAEDACLKCHARQDYKVHDVRGGVSITLDIHDMQEKLKSNTLCIIVLGVVTALLVLGLICYLTARLIKRISGALQQIEIMASTDVLTGLFNRRHVILRFAEEFERAKRLDNKLGCIILDIDHFKAVNDTYGHLAGDEVLKEVSDRLKNSIRTYDILGRYGGEEFMMVLPESGMEVTKILAERIRSTIRETPVRGLNITISLGAACMEDKDKSIDDIIKRADDGLYKAKNAGRDRVEWA